MTTAMPHAVITGASSGIGAAVATRLLDSGWRVTGIDRQPPPQRLAPRIVYLAADLTDPAAVDALPLPSAAGVDGVPLTWVDFQTGIRRFGAEILPILEARKLRHPA